MAFERVTIQLRDGRQHGGVDWPTVVEWVRQRRLPTNAMLTDEATGEQRPVSSFPELTAAANSAGGDDAASTIVPYKNPPALTSYYLGVFSLLACVPFLGVIGIPMAIAAFVLGLKGLRKVREQPECKGTAHAWIGIICGAIFTLLGLATQGLILASMLSSF
jgi:hypothetical protein